MIVAAAVLSEERDARLAAVQDVEIEAQRDGIFALRNALCTDDDAEVRAVCAERLGLLVVTRASGATATAVRTALLEALDDPSSMVRERAIHSLARHFEDRDHDLLPVVIERLREMVRLEPVWRVRRAAVRACASVDDDTIPTLVSVLDDPFWRVRYAAIQTLARDPSSVAAIEAAERTPRRDAALAYLRSCWSGAAAQEVEPADQPANVIDGLSDEDPAVVAVQLARMPDDAPVLGSLAALLASPHEVLRRVASKKLAQRGHFAELRAALAMLEDPRVPYVDETVRRLLTNADTRELRSRVLGEERPGPSALAWAITASSERGELVDAALDRFASHADARVRRASISAASGETPLATVVRCLADTDLVVRAKAAELLGRRADGHAALLALDVASEPFRVVRAIAVCNAAPAETLRSIARSRDPSARAAALARLSAMGSLDDDTRASASRDADPWIRAAALDNAHAVDAMKNDPDPWVRRAAFDCAVTAVGGGDARSGALMLALDSDDAWLRSRAADLLRRASDVAPAAAVEALLRLTRDAAPMARSAAAEALAGRRDAADACFEIAQRDPPVDEELRLAAHGRLVMEQSQRAFDALAHDLEIRTLSPNARFALLAMTLAYPDEVRRGSAHVYEPREVVARSAEPVAPRAAVARVASRRSLGATGVAISPLVVSGAFDLSPAWLSRAREAGVNAFFWEPEYRTMTEFLARAPRKEDLVVICGSYEADRKTIERDAERALRRLRVDSLGAMLLFWVRSPARLNDETWSALDRLKRSGKVRAIGFSTHLRELAARAIVERPWDVVMSRHSAAHTGLESTVLPVARERNVGVITFSALVYGRMISSGGFDAADCYRYSVAQPGVTACITAPRRQRELEENLGVLRMPSLSPEMITALREGGARVHTDNRAFMSLVRRP